MLIRPRPNAADESESASFLMETCQAKENCRGRPAFFFKPPSGRARGRPGPRESAFVTRSAVPPVQKRAANDAAFWLLLAALVGLRASAAAVPGMWFWAADASRFLPGWAWIFLLSSVVLLLPPVGRAALPPLRRLGEALARRPATLLAAGVAAAVVLLLPDRTRFVGDFHLRQGSVEAALPFGALFPQALPLDVLLHHTLPAWAQAVFGVPPNATSRALGALLAALAAGLAVRFARLAGASGAALPAVAALAGCGGWLALFTGYSKAFAGMAVLTAAVAVAGLAALRGRRAPWALGVLLGAALLLHRSALGLLPAAVFVFSASGTAGRGPRWARLGAAAPALLGLALAAPGILRGAGAYDAAHLLSRDAGGGGFARGLLAPLHLLDVANLVLFLVPLAPLRALAAGGGRRAKPAPALARREWVFLGLLAAPFVAALPLVHPAQGIPRDFDVFAAAGVTLAALLAAVVADRLCRTPGAAWLAPALVAAALAPPLEYLLLQADLDRGLARAEALVAGPPARPDDERAKASEFLGSRLYRAGRLREALAHYQRAAELGPSPNILMGWALVAGYAGDEASEERACLAVLERTPPEQAEFRRLAGARLAEIYRRRGDAERARRFESLVRGPPAGP